MSSWDALQQLIARSRSTDFAAFGEGREEHWIARTEARLGLSLPPSYRWWLRHYGGGEVGGEEIFSVYDTENPAGGGDLLRMHELNRRRGRVQGNELYLCQPGTDEEFFFRTSLTVNGEWPIIRRDRIHHTEEVYAPDFASFLFRKISEQG